MVGKEKKWLFIIKIWNTWYVNINVDRDVRASTIDDSQERQLMIFKWTQMSNFGLQWYNSNILSPFG